MTARFRVVEGSESNHCCFVASVVDTTKAQVTGSGKLITRDGVPRFEAVCECDTLADAETIASALNGAPR